MPEATARKIITEEIRFMGRVYRCYPNSKNRPDRVYYKRASGKWLHRDIWESYNRKKIPKGFHIHHIDENPRNNSPENLECISPREHIAKHPPKKEWLERRSDHLNEIRPLASRWHGSKAGLAWHSENGKKCRKNFVPVEKNCSFCGGVFLANHSGHRDKFCSNPCKSAHRRRAGTDNEERCCPQCNGIFSTNKYKETRFCSRSCAQNNRVKDKVSRL